MLDSQKEKIKKHIGEILLIAGSFVTTYELFSFKHSYYGSSGGLSGLPRLSEATNPAVYYYYSSESLLLLSLGVALVVLGILIIKKINN